MASVKAKAAIMEEKERLLLNPTIEPWEIVNIVNVAFAQSFAKVHTNKNAISERGWAPFNRNLMTYPCLRATMTKEEKDSELLDNSRVVLPYHKLHDVTDIVTIPTFDPKYAIHPVDEERRIVNFSHGIGASTLDKIVRHDDMQAARERIREGRDEGLSLKERLSKMKQITAGQLFKAKGCRIGKDIFAIRTENAEANKKERDNIMRKEKENYLKWQQEASDVLASGVTLDKMTNKQLLALLRPLKRKGDKAMPTTKRDRIARYNETKHRPPLTFDSVAEIVINNESDHEETMQDDIDEAAEAMLFLSEQV